MTTRTFPLLRPVSSWLISDIKTATRCNPMGHLSAIEVSDRKDQRSLFEDFDVDGKRTLAINWADSARRYFLSIAGRLCLCLSFMKGEGGGKVKTVQIY